METSPQPVLLNQRLEYPDNVWQMCHIPALGMDSSRALYVRQNSVASLNMTSRTEVSAGYSYGGDRIDNKNLEFDDDLLTMYSEGFSSCSAFIVRSVGGWMMAHIPPGAYELASEIRDRMELNSSEYLGSLLIRGSFSHEPGRLLQFLDENELMYGEVNVETGGPHFSVSLDIESGVVSVARKKPVQEVLQYSYNPFIAR